MVGITNIFWIITILLIIYAYFFDFPIVGDNMFLVWLFAFMSLSFYVMSNKTKLKKDSKTGYWKEVTIKKSIVEQETELHNAEVKARAKEKLRQKKLSQKKQIEIENKQRLDKQKVIIGNIAGSGLMDKVKRLKKLYINGTLTKAEFEKAKNKLLK